MKKLLLITTALAVGLAGPAHADPISAAVAWVGSTFAVSAAAATLIVNFAVSTALTAISSALYKPKLPGQDVSFDVKMGDDQPLSFVAGRFATAGKRKYIGSWGDNTRFITEVVEYSALPQGLDGIWINDERGNIRIDDGMETLGGIANVGYRLTNYNRDGATRIWVRWLDGTQLAADPTLIALFGGDASYPWTTNHIGRGKSYAIITSLYDDEILTSYPTFLLEPSPLPLYDWRRDSTNGGSGAQRWGDRSTYQPTLNPAVISYNIVRGIYYGTEWVYGGKNLPAWRLPVAEWSAAANACDQDINLAVGGVQPRYRCGLEISVDMEPASVLDEIGKSANMKFCEVGGRLKPIVDLPGAAVFAFTDGDILITEGQSFSPFYPAVDTFNAISATYPEPGEKWATMDAPEYVNTEAREDDGGQHLPTSMSYGAVPFGNQVQRLMRSQMRDFRRMRRHQFYLPPDAYALEPGIDMVSWTSERNGYINKQFMVESVSKTPGMNVLVSLREVDPSDYDWSSDFERPIVITPPVNPRPFVQPIRGLAVLGTSIQDAAGAARRPAILVACDGDERGVTHIQIEARRVGTTQTIIDTERPFAEPHSWYLLNVLPATAYEVRARLISDLTPRSAWSSWLTATTPDVRLGGNDVRYEEIAEEVREDLSDLTDWIDEAGPLLRGVRDEITSIRDGVAQGEFGTLLARDQLRRGLLVEIGQARASFDEQIDVIITDQMSAALRTSELRAEFQQTTAVVRSDQIALASETRAVGARVETVEVDLYGAEGSASEGLMTRVDTAEGELIVQSDAITTVTARTDRGTATGLFRVSAESSPAGVQSRIGLRAEASNDESTHSAALFLEANTDGTSQVIVAADRFAIATGQGPAATRQVPFVIDGPNVYMGNAIVRTLSIGDNQVTVSAAQTLDNAIQGNDGWQVANVLAYTLPNAGAVTIEWNAGQGYDDLNKQPIGFRLRIDGDISWSVGGNGQRIETDFLSMAWKRILSAGGHVIAIEWFGAFSVTLYSRTLIVDGAMR